LVPPKYLEFKADDGTIFVRGLQLPPNSDSSQKIPLIALPSGPAGQSARKSRGGTTELFHQNQQEGFAILL
jgi:hypothetical protein